MYFVRVTLLKVIVLYNESQLMSLDKHAHSRTAVRSSCTERAMHTHIIWCLRAKTYSNCVHS